MSKGSKYTVQNQIYLIACMSKELKCLVPILIILIHLIARMSKESKVQYIVYSYELNDSKSESNEVHTLELPLLMFITLSTT